jgi:biopolymer transport protein ExbD
MKLYNFRTILLFIAALVVGIYFAYWYISQQKTESTFVLKISKEFKPNLTDDELAQFVADGYEFPNSLLELLEKKHMFLHSSPMLLVVSTQKDGKIKLNIQNEGNLSNTQSLTNHLTSIFTEREKNLVFEEGTNNILKKVIIKSNCSISYGDVVKVIDAVKSAGAEPIVLQIDNLPK